MPNRNRHRLSALICLAAAASMASAQTTYRTVIDKELGSFYESAGSIPLTDYGMFVGSPSSLDPAAQRAMMAHFDKFASQESLTTHSFPYAAFAAYDASERAAGRPGLFITATYQGTSRPVYFSWTLNLVNNVPTAPQSQWQRAVNVSDPRFVHFWINHYMEALMSEYQSSTTLGPNLGFQLDECSFEYTLFGVLNNSNQFVPGVTWDSAFPQNQTEYEAGVESFFTQVHTLAPNLTLLPNIGSQVTPSHFPTLFQYVSGGLMEDIYSWMSDDIPYVRNEWYSQNFVYLPWLGSQNKMSLMRGLIPSTDSNGLLTSFVMYSLFRGANSFFAPGNTSNDSLSPSTWSGMRAQLGNPVAAMTSGSAGSEGVGYRLYSRAYEGGTVYLNWTGQTQIIALNPSTAYYNSSGTLLSSHTLQIADAIGSYVTTSPHALAAPSISPRGPSAYAAPLAVTLATSVSGGTIHYTLDGTMPTASSPTYTSPISLTKSTIVTARVFEGSYSSFESTASYTIASGTPTAGFLLKTDAGLSGSYYPIVELSAVPTEAVTIDYSVTNGTPATGKYTFLPGMTYGILPVTTGSSGTTTVTITSVIGASRNANQTFEYTINPSL